MPTSTSYSLRGHHRNIVCNRWQADVVTSNQITRLTTELSAVAEHDRFSGVALIEHRGHRILEFAGGLANRGESTPMTVNTRLGTASGTKGFTALAVVSLIEEGVLGFETALAEVVGDDLPHVDDTVTIAHLLGHTSGVGDYLDEEQLGDIDDHVLDVPVHLLEGPEDYLPILNRYQQHHPPGSRFAYNNSGYVMLALAIERATGSRYHDEVRRRVFEPASMEATDFIRSDRLPGGVALGYLADGRTNVFHLPVIGTGDGGAYTTAPDMVRFWDALLAGRIVDTSLVERMTTARVVAGSGHESGALSYGLGFWIGKDGTTVQLEGMDAGVSMRSGANRQTGLCYCFIANNSSDVWPLAKIIDDY